MRQIVLTTAASLLLHLPAQAEDIVFKRIELG